MSLDTSIRKNACTCPHCSNTFSNKENLRRHIRQYCHVLKEAEQELERERIRKIEAEKEMEKIRQKASEEALQRNNEVKRLSEEIRDLKNLILNRSSENKSQASINNNYNHLNVMCMSKNDDFLQMLTLKDGAKKALTFIKNCALARLPGDCRILERIYFPPDKKPALMYANRSRTQFVYYDENQKRIVEGNAKVIAKILAENIQRSYLKGSQSLRDGEGKPIYVEEDHPFLPVIEEFDMFTWNSHIYELNDEKYQKKVLNSIRIPFEGDVVRGGY